MKEREREVKKKKKKKRCGTMPPYAYACGYGSMAVWHSTRTWFACAVSEEEEEEEAAEAEAEAEAEAGSRSSAKIAALFAFPPYLQHTLVGVSPSLRFASTLAPHRTSART